MATQSGESYHEKCVSQGNANNLRKLKRDQHKLSGDEFKLNPVEAAVAILKARITPDIALKSIDATDNSIHFVQDIFPSTGKTTVNTDVLVRLDFECIVAKFKAADLSHIRLAAFTQTSSRACVKPSCASKLQLTMRCMMMVN